LYIICVTIATIATEFYIMPAKTKSAFMSVRVTELVRTKFHAKARKLGTPSEVHRELVEAFVENRLEVQPPVIRKPLEKIYEPRT
jgi:hypothetical protein